MGKSPGKWIKTLLFGKKTSKSNLSKNATPDREDARKTPAEDNSPVVSDPQQFAEKRVENIELEKGTSGNSSTVNQGLEAQSNFVSVPLSDDEMRRQGRAATKAQAVFRGYLARRAFRALKGIIRLQALIRGHLVRRQAVATLRCMQAVVKLQALARARRVDIGANSTFGSGKLATNAYVRKLLISLPAVTPLSLQYDPTEPNSAWNWLERWSLSRFWDPPARPKKASSIKPHNKQSGSQNAENDRMKSKRTTRKASIGDNGTLSSFETDKPKRNPKKSETDFLQEQAQNELERVKRSLRKVSASQTPAPEKLETENEKPNKVSEGKIVISAENLANLDLVVDKVDFLEAPMTANVLNGDCPLIETHLPENSGKIETVRFPNDELSSKEDDSRKLRKRRSLPEYSENISLNTPSLPSYMMATESAKAKLRAQEGSAKLISEDGTEVGYIRRHSLPASTNGKISSLSPKVHNRVHGNGKGGSSKSSRSMASKDDKVLQSGWRR